MKLNFDELVKQKSIKLSNKGLRGDDLDVLYKVIEQSAVLKTLVLGANNLTLSDGKLANAIANNTTIDFLNLSYNNISQQGIEHLAAALKDNDTLEILYLDNNNIGGEGAQSVATLLENKILREIHLDTNMIGDQGAEKLAEALESNHSIKTLDLQRNNISSRVRKKIEAILNHPKRKENTMLKQSIAKKDEELEGRDKEIESLKKESAKKDRDISKLSQDNAKKDKQIASLKAAIRGQIQQLGTILDPIDLKSEDDKEPPNKRARTGDTPKSVLAIQHEQNQQHNQRLVQVKQEKSDAETALEGVRVEKQAVEANLEGVREELEDAEELVGQQAVATNIWQGRFDEIVGLVESGQEVDGAAISAIRNRSLASGS